MTRYRQILSQEEVQSMVEERVYSLRNGLSGIQRDRKNVEVIL